MFDTSALIPLVAKLGGYAKQGLDHYAALRAAGMTVTPDVLAVFLADRMSAWDPIVSGRALLDTPTRDAAARFLAGVVFNLSKERA